MSNFTPPVGPPFIFPPKVTVPFATSKEVLIPAVQPPGPPFVPPTATTLANATSKAVLTPAVQPPAPPMVIPPAVSKTVQSQAPAFPNKVTTYVPYQVTQLQTQKLFGIVDSNSVLINTPYPNIPPAT